MGARKRLLSGLAVGLAVVVAGCFDVGSVSGGTAQDGGASSGSSSGSFVDSDGGTASGDHDAASVIAETDGAPSAAVDYCASRSPQPTFCDDFDDYDTGALAMWDQTIQDNGSVTLDALDAFTKPYSMEAQTGTAAGGVQTEADVLKAFPAYAGKGIVIDATFEMSIDTWDTATTGQIIAFEVIFKNSSAMFNQIVLNLNSLGAGGVSAQVAENAQGSDGGEAGYNSYPFESHPPTKTWTTIEVILSVPNPTGTQSNTVTVKVGGVTQISAQALGVAIQGGTPTVHLGIGYVATPAGPWVVHYDNFATTITSF